MLGAIIGDICGSIYEFHNCKDISKVSLMEDKYCTLTDDTVMTVAVAQALMDAKDDDVRTEDEIALMIERLMRYYGSAYPCAGYGGMFSEWLDSPIAAPYNSFGNGSAMRVSSVGWLYGTLKETQRYARLTASVTHNHPEGIKGAEAIASVIYLARNGCGKQTIKTFIERYGYDLSFSVDEIRPTYEFNETCQASVPQAVKCFLESTDFEQCIKLTISLGGDSDTLAAISGGIAEAYYGIPKTFEEKVYNYLPESMALQCRRFKKYVDSFKKGL